MLAETDIELIPGDVVRGRAPWPHRGGEGAAGAVWADEFWRP